MNKLTMAVLMLLTLDYSNVAVAANRPLNRPIVKPPVVLPPIVVPPVQQTGNIINYQPSGGTNFSLFWVNKARIQGTVLQALASLNRQVSSIGITPCLVPTDVNATPISCGSGLVNFGINQLFSSSTAINLGSVPVRLPRGVKTVYGANFLSPKGTIAGDSTGRTVDISFSEPVAEFAMEFDPGQSLTSSITSVDFYDGNALLGSYTFNRGVKQWAGLQIPAGIQNLTIVPVGGDTNSQAFKTDMFTVVTKAQFDLLPPL